MVRIAGWSVIALVLLLLVEALSFAALKAVPRFSSRVYSPPDVDAAAYAAYRDQRDPLLGWPSPDWLADQADDRGARTSPANAALAGRPVCASVFGDSFAFSDEVDPPDAWANVMAERLGCQVLNFGVGGYGTDQALLRMRQKTAETVGRGDLLILSVYPDNLNRVANRWRYLLSGYRLGFKPAFVKGADGFRLHPPFDGDHAAFLDLAAAPESALAGEQFAPDAAGFGRMVTGGFPYSWTLARIAVKEVSGIRGLSVPRPNFMNYPVYFDTSDGPSPAKREVMEHVLSQFASLCAEQARDCVLLLIPDPDLVYQRDSAGAHSLGWLLKAVPPRIAGLDATALFGDVDDICNSLTRPDTCQGHFNAEGYRRLAGFVADGLRTAYPGRFAATD